MTPLADAPVKFLASSAASSLKPVVFTATGVEASGVVTTAGVTGLRLAQPVISNTDAIIGITAYLIFIFFSMKVVYVIEII
ncbi:hypothetical protein GCM10027155_08600 [Acinetobacter apis]